MLDELIEERLKKLARLKDAGVDPYPAKAKRSHTIGEALKKFSALSKGRKKISVAGRIMGLRDQGGVFFLDLRDESGQIQAVLKKENLPKFNFWKSVLDRGDFVSIHGPLMKTKRGEKSVDARELQFLAKSIRPLPEKWHGLQDVEERFRRRYLDALLNPKTKEVFETRTAIVRELRNFMEREGFLEVETPTLQPLAGGALARPFKTKINALDMELSLRIAPELFLKRLLVAGFEKVCEFSRNFRNEGMDKDHNPEFSELEFYAAYKDYEWLMEFTEKMLKQVVVKIFRTTKIKYEGREIDFQGPYPRVEFGQLLKKYAGLDYDSASAKDFANKARELGITVNKEMTKGNVADEICKKVARPSIIQPTFVVNHPVEISPLAKKLVSDPNRVARVQLLVAGNEIVNAYSELNDPIDQRERFEEQGRAEKSGNEEAHPYDEDFVEALEFGMPPAAGWGMGIDRLVAILTNSHSIREVMLFPLMKPKD